MTDSSSAFFQAMRALYDAAGQPSYRSLAGPIGCSVATVHGTLTGRNRPRWPLLTAIVRELDGDPEDFRELWLAAQLGAQLSDATRHGLNGYVLSEERTADMIRAAAFALAGAGVNAHDCGGLARAAVQAAVNELLFPSRRTNLTSSDEPAGPG